jgi:hypothetical protein
MPSVSALSSQTRMEAYHDVAAGDCSRTTEDERSQNKGATRYLDRVHMWVCRKERALHMKKFSDTQPTQVREDDRLPLKEGECFILTGFVIAPSGKYKDGIAKLNGQNIVDNKPVKFWYSGKAVIHQLTEMERSVGVSAGLLKEPVRVMVVTVKGEKGSYLSLADPV